MKVLQVHNFYQQPGGEDTVFRQEAALMSEHGWEVIQYTAHNDSIVSAGLIGKAKAAFSPFWSNKHHSEITRTIRKEKPNVCHVHNFFPLISPSIFYACRSQGVPVVMTVHNYRLMCANGLFLRDGHACEECLETNMFHAVKYGCYKDSKLFSAITAGAYEWHHYNDTWNKKVDRFIALTPFMKEKLTAKGIEADRIAIKPNFISLPELPASQPGKHLLFIGRLDRIKGADLLAKVAEQLPEVQIKVLGEGILKDSLSAHKNIELLGHQPHDAVLRHIAACRAVILPTRFYEGMPMTIIESLACGKPVITANHGPLPDMISEGETGWLFKPNNAEDLVRCARTVMETTIDISRMAQRCTHEYRNKYTPEVNFERMTEIYNSVAHA